jgi:uncharacterized protein YbaP (TraB family)
MKSISFFTPVYIDSQNSDTTFWQKCIINSTEFIFNFDNISFSTPPNDKKVAFISDKKRTCGETLLQSISLIAVIILFPLGIALLGAKISHRWDQYFQNDPFKGNEHPLIIPARTEDQRALNCKNELLGSSLDIRLNDSDEDQKINEKSMNDGIIIEEVNLLVQETYKGFLYEIKREQQIVAYLCGTQHYVPKSWQGLNSQTETALQRAGVVFLEAIVANNNEQLNEQLDAVGLKLGIDYEIIATATKKEIKMEALDSVESRISQSSTTENINLNLQMACQLGEYDFQENLDNEILAWQNGDETLVCSSLEKKAKFIKNEWLRELINHRNFSWMIKISEALKAPLIESKPSFIAVGCTHLFDCENISEGLITRIRNLQFTVKKIE